MPITSGTHHRIPPRIAPPGTVTATDGGSGTGVSGGTGVIGYTRVPVPVPPRLITPVQRVNPRSQQLRELPPVQAELQYLFPYTRVQNEMIVPVPAEIA